MQYIFAKDWPMKVYFALAGLVGVWVAVSACQPSLLMFRDWHFLLLFLVAIVIAPFLGFFLSVPVAFIFLAPIYHLRAKLNGAPFQIGDHVRVLAGPYRDSIVQVYAVWTERNQVRVELDAQAKTDVKDVYSFTQVCRETLP
jgi:hypothetical protein